MFSHKREEVVGLVGLNSKDSAKSKEEMRVRLNSGIL